MNKRTFQKEFVSWTRIALGTTVMCAGFVLFINPYNIIPGGIYGTSIVLHNIFPSIQVGTFGYFFDIPLLIISLLFLGAKLGSKTLVASMSTPLVMNAISLLIYPNQEALQALDPTQMLGGLLNLSDHLLLATIMGSLFIGFGGGMIVKGGATSGGTDIIGMLMHKYLGVRFSNALLLVDAVVVLFGLLVLGFGVGNVSEAGMTATEQQAKGIIMSFYSLLSIYLATRVLARTINGPKDDKLIFIISNKNLEELHRYILDDLDRTATLIKSSGLYSQEEKEMLFIVLSYKEVHRLKHAVREADKDAFMIVTDAYDTYGEKWKRLPSNNELQPE